MPSNKPWSYDRTRWTRLYNSTNGVQGLGLKETDRRYYLAACALWESGNDCGCYSCTETARWAAADILGLDRINWKRWTDVLLMGQEYGLFKLSYNDDGYLDNWPEFNIIKHRRIKC